MMHENKQEKYEVYDFKYLGDRVYCEGLIEGYGFILYGHTYSFVPVFTREKPDEEKLKPLVDCIVAEMIQLIQLHRSDCA